LVGTGKKSLVRGVDQARKLFAQGRVVETQRRHQARPEILDHDVRLADQLQRRRVTFGRVDVEHNAFLVAIEGAEEADPKSWQLARLVAAGWLDLDDFRTKVGKDHSERVPQ